MRRVEDLHREIALLVSVLSHIFNASLEHDSLANRYFVAMNLPAGPTTWEVSDLDIWLFDHLPKNLGRKFQHDLPGVRYATLTGSGPAFASYVKFLKNTVTDYQNAMLSDIKEAGNG